MNDLLIFLLGLVITIVTVTAVLFVGQAEADDPALNRSGEGAAGPGASRPGEACRA